MKVIVRGPLLSKSGYGEHTRQVFKWALSRGHDVTCQILNWGITPWYIDRDELDGLVGQIIDRATTLQEKADMSLQVQLPNEWDPGIAKYNVGITAGVETDRCSIQWKFACNKMSHIIVPSTFTKNTFVADDVIKVPVTVVPESFCPSIIKEVKEIDLSEITTKFNFLLFGQITGNDYESDRKNIFYTVKWFCEEFSNDKDVGLVIKSNLGTNCTFHRHTLKNTFTNFIKQVRKSEYPKIYLINGDLSQDEVASLLRSPKVDVMLSLTKGEGYGIPLVDAAASDLPVMATNWSGHLDFLSHGNFSKIEYDLVEIPKNKVDNNIFVDGAKWAMPLEAEAKRKMRKAVNSQSKPIEWAKDLGKIVREKYSFDAVCLAYDEILGNIK